MIVDEYNGDRFVHEVSPSRFLLRC
jgi:hypothetical protein